jgi:hypothetical protein
LDHAKRKESTQIISKNYDFNVLKKGKYGLQNRQNQEFLIRTFKV